MSGAVISSPVWRLDTTDALQGLAGAPEEFFHSCITSPPYWGGIRDYAVPELHWPGMEYSPLPGLPPIQIDAWSGALGHEPSVFSYVGHLVHIMRLVWRVLRWDATFWLNLGDTFASGGRGGGPAVEAQLLRAQGDPRAQAVRNVSRRWLNPEMGGFRKWRSAPDGHKHKDLVGIPWLVAQALKADGWMLRAEVIWYKLNGWPESVEDRPTRAHEQVFLLTKSPGPVYWTHRDFLGERRMPAPDRRWIHRETRQESSAAPAPDWRWINRETGEVLAGDPNDVAWKKVNAWRRVNLWAAHDYFFDLEALREPLRPESIRRSQYGRNPGHKWAKGQISREFRYGGTGVSVTPFHPPEAGMVLSGRAVRTVWPIANGGSSLPHFATFPDELASRCMLLGTSLGGCCPSCGAPLSRVTEIEYVPSPGHGDGSVAGRRDPSFEHGRDGSLMPRLDKKVITKEWRPTCGCAEASTPIPCRVVDPFAGSGTVIRVGQSQGRSVYGIELSPTYAAMAREDLCSIAPLFVPLNSSSDWEKW